MAKVDEAMCPISKQEHLSRTHLDPDDAPQSRLSRKPNSTTLGDEIFGNAESLDAMRRKRIGELEDFEESFELCVKTFGGGDVLRLTTEKAFGPGLTVRQLREMVVKALSRAEDVELVFKVRPLEEQNSLEDLLRQEDPCETVGVAHHFPQCLSAIPVVEELEVLKKLLHSEEHRATSVSEIRKMLGVDEPPSDKATGHGFLPHLLGRLSRKEHATVIAKEHGGNADVLDVLNDKQTRKFEDFKQSFELCVKTIGGEDVLSLTTERASGLTVRHLRERVVESLCRTEEVKLVFKVRRLEEQNSLEELLRQMLE